MSGCAYVATAASAVETAAQSNPASAFASGRMAAAGPAFGLPAPPLPTHPPGAPRSLATFLRDLVTEASREVRQVHGIVLPELALEEHQAKEVASILAKETEIEFFVTGIGGSAESAPINRAYTAVTLKSKSIEWEQSKHHRWRLDADQIKRYQLSDALDPRQNWWERIDIPSPRTCNFYVIRDGATLAALVCEDLARIDPVQAALRAVGPNLVVVLLMDGPQYDYRWSARYATVLADDPGSSVLTVTCLGMLKRSGRPGESLRPVVALWRDRFGPPTELSLPPGDHGLLLTLASRWEECRTVDGRKDNGTTLRFLLGGVAAVRHRQPPAWL